MFLLKKNYNSYFSQNRMTAPDFTTRMTTRVYLIWKYSHSHQLHFSQADTHQADTRMNCYSIDYYNFLSYMYRCFHINFLSLWFFESDKFWWNIIDKKLRPIWYKYLCFSSEQDKHRGDELLALPHHYSFCREIYCK